MQLPGKAEANPTKAFFVRMISSSALYQRSMPKMREISKDWIAYTNVRKQFADKARTLEEEAKPVALYKISKNAQVNFPKLVGKVKLKPANISYPVEKKRAEKLADAFGDINMTYRDIGEYTYEEFVGKD